MVKVLRSQANPGLSKALALAQQRATELEAVLQASKAERQRLIQRCHEGEEKLKGAQNDVSAYKRTIREYANAFHTLQSDARRRDGPGPPAAAVGPRRDEERKREEARDREDAWLARLDISH